MSRSGLSSLKHEVQTSVLGLDKTRIANLLNAFKTFAVSLFILTLIFRDKVFLVKKIGRKIYTTVCLSDIKALIKH